MEGSLKFGGVDAAEKYAAFFLLAVAEVHAVRSRPNATSRGQGISQCRDLEALFRAVLVAASTSLVFFEPHAEDTPLLARRILRCLVEVISNDEREIG